MYSKSIFQTTLMGKQQKNQFQVSQCASSREQDPIITIPRMKSAQVPTHAIQIKFQKAESQDINYQRRGSESIEFNCMKKQRTSSGFQMYRKSQKKRSKNCSDYKKNICGYITKKVMREFVSFHYMQRVKNLCYDHQCDYNEVKNYYSTHIQRVTGPSHVPELLIANSHEERKVKRVFKEFFEWFLRERYVRYLLGEGKMSDKKAYIEYKNTCLISLIHECENNQSLIKLGSDSPGHQLPKPAVDQPKNCPIQIHIPIAIKPLQINLSFP